MARSLSLVRRRANLVDITIAARANVASYKFYAMSNYDGTPTLFDTVPIYGKRSATVVDSSYGEQFKNLTRFLFNPADYSLTDTSPIWLQIKQVATDGTVETDFEAAQLILPYSSQPNRPVVLKGSAPSGTSITDSLELQLPGQCNNLVLQVDGATDMQIAFEPGGPEQRVPALSTEFTNFETVYPAFTQLFVRGDGGASSFSATMRLISGPLI